MTATPDSVVRQPRLETKIGNLDVLAFQASGGLVALLNRSPLAIFAFWLRVPGAPALGLVSSLNRAPMIWLGSPSDIVTVTSDGVTWLLDGDTGFVTSINISASQTAITGLDRSVRTACALQERTIAFLNTRVSGTVFLGTLDSPSVVYELPIPGDLVARVPWDQLRLVGSATGPCALWAPGLPGILVVTETAVQPVAPLVETLPAEPWHVRFGRWVARRPPPRGVLDVTTVPGGVALLFAGRTAEAGRLVDFYRTDGSYIETMLLPHRAHRIAGTEHRLFAISQRSDKIYLESYRMPQAVRVLAPTQEQSNDLSIDRPNGS